MKPFRTQQKYGAKRTNGYASKREAAYADVLRAQKQSGAIAGWLEQVAIKLPGGVKYVCDFMILANDGKVLFVEVKGHTTEAWKVKMRVLQETRPEFYALLEVVK